ncbi:hypothetical protein SAMN04487905_10126 [Actinopolyspora xinjiangensis]|uniref:Uncharacterized protein n=1 Tax=Actinopolyspora xinjiangensis TaxID=405564 RepID=A0A1H0N8J2_9ACTN|nr:hypothetical protein [Actinopolyspora xinjiangensis]SDO88660.1 hypothetical protein SAMN04487905_10126 [Actinopolyspora xinjiangensis]
MFETHELTEENAVDESELAPLGTHEEFRELLVDLVRASAPEVFALCEEIGDRADGVVRYWGLSHRDGTEVFAQHGGLNGRFRSPESALRLLSGGRAMHLVRLGSETNTS